MCYSNPRPNANTRALQHTHAHTRSHARTGGKENFVIQIRCCAPRNTHNNVRSRWHVDPIRLRYESLCRRQCRVWPRSVPTPTHDGDGDGDVWRTRCVCVCVCTRRGVVDYLTCGGVCAWVRMLAACRVRACKTFLSSCVQPLAHARAHTHGINGGAHRLRHVAVAVAAASMSRLSLALLASLVRGPWTSQYA